MHEHPSNPPTASFASRGSRGAPELASADNAQLSVGGMSLPEACRFIGIGRSLAFSEIRAGRLRARKIGRRTIVTREDAIMYLRSLPIAGAAA
jgi:hypothetical protein